MTEINHDLFDDLEGEGDSALTEWRGMPEFNQPDNTAYRQVLVSFEDEDAIASFMKLLDVHMTSKTKSLWWPVRQKNNVADLFYISDDEDDT